MACPSSTVKNLSLMLEVHRVTLIFPNQIYSLTSRALDSMEGKIGNG